MSQLAHKFFFDWIFIAFIFRDFLDIVGVSFFWATWPWRGPGPSWFYFFLIERLCKYSIKDINIQCYQRIINMMWGEIILDILPNGGGVGVLALLIFEVSGNADFEFANDELSKAKCVDRKDRAVRDPRRFVNDSEFGLLIHGSSFLLTVPIWASILKHIHEIRLNRN